MKLNEIYKQVAKLEGKKKQVSIAQIREIIGIISDLMLKHPKIISTLYRLGERRSKK